MSEWDGKDFRALRRLSSKDNETVAEVGETCERVPVSSLEGLLHSGKIERIVPVDTKRKKSKVSEEHDDGR